MGLTPFDVQHSLLFQKFLIVDLLIFLDPLEFFVKFFTFLHEVELLLPLKLPQKLFFFLGLGENDVHDF